MTNDFTPTVVERDGERYMGTHLLIDVWDASVAALTSPSIVERVLREAANTAGATILFGYFHHFGPNSGVSGVLVLAESHISIHTWPELRYAAVDVFVCGDCDPWKAAPVLEDGFEAGHIKVIEELRGALSANQTA